MARVSIWQVLYGALQKGCLKHKFRQTLVIEHDKDLQTTQSHRASVYSMQFEIAWEARMLLSTKQKQPCLPSNVCCFVESNWFGMELYTICLVQKHWMVTVIAQQQAVSLSLQSILSLCTACPMVASPLEFVCASDLFWLAGVSKPGTGAEGGPVPCHQSAAHQH